jgi:hypothetical protein
MASPKIKVRNLNRDHARHIRSADGDSVTVYPRSDHHIDKKFEWGLSYHGKDIKNLTATANSVPVTVSAAVTDKPEAREHDETRA